MFPVGFISRQLAPEAKTLVGVDISQGMVDEYNHRVMNQGIPPEEMHAVCVELKGEDGELEGARFDVIVVGIIWAMSSRHSADQFVFPSVRWRTTISVQSSKCQVYLRTS